MRFLRHLGPAGEVMKKRKKSRGGRQSTNRLMRQGYSLLSRITLLLARTGLVDPFMSARTILPRRAISVVSVLSTGTKSTKIQLSLVTANINPERAAACVHVDFFSFFGRKLNSEHTSQRHDFFADTLSSVVPQNAYFDVPIGAKWVAVKIKRSGSSRRIGVHGSLRPKAIGDVQQVPLAEALVSRDRMILEAHLSASQAGKDRQTAMRLLERMIYLERREADEILLRVISDLNSAFRTVPARLPEEPTKPQFDYKAPLVGAYSPTVPLSKWLVLETRALRAAAKGSHARISNNDQAGIMVLACLLEGLPFSIADLGAQQLAAFHPWVFDSDFSEILAFNTGH